MPNKAKSHRPPHARPRSTDRHRRGTATQRGYDTTWNKFSKRYKQQHPLCVDCLAEGITALGDELDHIIPLDARPDLKYDERNLANRCKRHHIAKTKRDAEIVSDIMSDGDVDRVTDKWRTGWRDG